MSLLLSMRWKDCSFIQIINDLHHYSAQNGPSWTLIYYIFELDSE